MTQTRRNEIMRYDVLCETTPYTLISITTKDNYGDIVSYFQYIYIDDFELRICDTNNPYSNVYMDLADNEKPYLEKDDIFYNLHIPRNTVIKRENIDFGNTNTIQTNNNGSLPFIAGAVGLATGFIVGSQL
jgi:hypothetical protein